MSAPDHAPDANFDAMNLATPGKDASNPDKPAPKKAQFSSPPANTYNKSKNSTPATLHGCDPTATPEQICRTMIGKIDALPLLSTGLRTSTTSRSRSSSVLHLPRARDRDTCPWLVHRLAAVPIEDAPHLEVTQRG